jgi:hypothetical protein
VLKGRKQSFTVHFGFLNTQITTQKNLSKIIA